MFDSLVMHRSRSGKVPAIKIDTPYGQVYAYKAKDELKYDFPPGQAGGKARKFLAKSAEEVRALILIMENRL